MMRSDLLPDALLWITGIFRARSIPFQIAGGLAAHVYGSRRPINNEDIAAVRAYLCKAA